MTGEVGKREQSTIDRKKRVNETWGPVLKVPYIATLKAIISLLQNPAQYLLPNSYFD